MVQDAKPNSIDKAFGILKAFKSEDVNGVGVSELARRVDLPKSTTHRLLNKLVENDAVLKANELYRLNPALGMASTPEVYSWCDSAVAHWRPHSRLRDWHWQSNYGVRRNAYRAHHP